ncbi:MAG: lipoyl(octanoyl) transferase LipB [Saprospiraceae bacterium]
MDNKLKLDLPRKQNLESGIDLRSITIENWGLIDYKKAWDQQTSIHQEIIEKKRNKTENSFTGPGRLIFCEHEKVFTLGRSGKESNLLMNLDWLKSKGIDFYKINRGGDITYHGPGQIVLYPIIDLDYFFNDVHKYVRKLEEIVIQVIATFNIQGYRHPDFTGVWVKSRMDGHAKKICAIGVHMSRWVTLHGLAFNVHTDLTPFEYIVPCGIRDPEKGVTSLHLETELEINRHHVQALMEHHFAKEFDCKYIEN